MNDSNMLMAIGYAILYFIPHSVRRSGVMVDVLRRSREERMMDRSTLYIGRFFVL